MTTEDARNDIPGNTTLNVLALHHLERASELAGEMDGLLGIGLLNENEQQLFSYAAHGAGLHAQIAATTAQIVNASAVERMPEILSKETTRLEAGAVAQEQTTVTYRQTEVRDHAPAFQDQRDRAGIGPEDAVEVVRIHTTEYPDMEVRAEIWNDGYDTCMKQEIGDGEKHRVWLENKLGPVLESLGVPSDSILDSIIDAILDTALVEDADSDTRPDQQRGMYGKYFVQRLHDPEGKHTDDRFFVLDPEHDMYAREALKTYAALCRKEYPKLYEDLQQWIAQMDGGA